MGRHCDVICSGCGHRYTARWGGTFLTDLLHCEECGAELTLDRQEMPGCADAESVAQACTCGGRFTTAALPRCPACGSLEHEDDPKGKTDYVD